MLAITPAALRFVSVEPILGSVILGDHQEWIDWVICGAETGPHARPYRSEWIRHLRDECIEANIPFFLKQLSHGKRELDGQRWEQRPEKNI